MYAQRIDIPILADGAGAATVLSNRFTGEIRQLVYTAGSPAFASTVDFTITLEATGENLWTESNIAGATSRAPRLPTHDQVGVARLYAAGGVAVADRIMAADDRIKVVIAQAGAAGVGTITAIIG